MDTPQIQLFTPRSSAEIAVVQEIFREYAQGLAVDLRFQQFDEELAKKILSQDEVVIDICVNEGEHEATCWGCDLTYDYVKINGDYRS